MTASSPSAPSDTTTDWAPAAISSRAAPITATRSNPAGVDIGLPMLRSSSARLGLMIAGRPGAPRSSAWPSVSSTAGTDAPAAMAVSSA